MIAHCRATENLPQFARSEAVYSNEAEVCEQIRLTVIHELGHYFGMDENQLKDA